MLWCIFVPLGPLFTAPGAWRALRDLERCEPELDLQGPRWAAAAAGLMTAIALAVGVLDVGGIDDSAFALVFTLFTLALIPAGIFDFARAMRTWTPCATTPAAVQAWRRVQVAAALAIGIIVPIGATARADSDGSALIGFVDVDLVGLVGEAVLLVAIIVSFALFAYVDSAADHTKVVLDPNATLHVPFYRRWRRSTTAAANPSPPRADPAPPT